MNEFIEHMDNIEQDAVETFVASSFLPSHLFSKSTVLRYFKTDLGNKEAATAAANALWHRRKHIHMNMNKLPYREIWEINAFEDFCNKGITHRENPSFKATPKEIIQVLQNTSLLLAEFPEYELALCREVLPFVFTVKVGLNLTIDVRNNFGYQRIQGMVIDDPQIMEEFEREFWRIWKEDTTLFDKEQISAILKERIALISDSSHFLIGL